MKEQSPEKKPAGKRPLVIHPNWLIIPFEIILVIQSMILFFREDVLFLGPLLFGALIGWWFGLFSPWKNCLRNALVAWRRGQLDKAEKLYDRLHGYLDRFGPNDWRRGLILLHVADYRRSRGNYDEAQTLYGEAVEIFHHNMRRVELLVALNNLAVLFTNLGRYPEAARSYRRALAIIDGGAKAQPWMKAMVLVNLGSIACKTYKLDEAEDWLDEAEEALQKAWLNKAVVKGYLLCNRARIHLRSDYFEQAQEVAQQAWPLLQPFPEHRHVPQVVLAEALSRQGRFQEAEEPARLALQNAEAIGGADNPVLVDFLSTLASVCLGLDQLTEADSLFQKALQLHQRWQLPDLPDWAETLEQYACLLRRQNRAEEAQQWENQAAHIRQPPPLPQPSETPVIVLPKKIDDRFKAP